MATCWLRSVASTRRWSLRNSTFGSKPGKGSAWNQPTSTISYSPPCLSSCACSWTGWTCWRQIRTRFICWETRNILIADVAWFKRLPMRKLADSSPVFPKSSKNLIKLWFNGCCVVNLGWINSFFCRLVIILCSDGTFSSNTFMCLYKFKY